MNFLYTPNDIAVFLLKADFTLSDENDVIHDLWKNGVHIAKKYKKDEALFKRHIRAELASYTQGDETDELELIMRDVDASFTIRNPEYEQDYIFQYFKVICLELMYIYGKDYHKIKLRHLLRQFGYKRRSPQIMDHIKRAIKTLSLVIYLARYVRCEIDNIGIDEMVIIRLKR